MKSTGGPSRTERRRQGKALREKCSRSSQGEWKPRSTSQDIIRPVCLQNQVQEGRFLLRTLCLLLRLSQIRIRPTLCCRSHLQRSELRVALATHHGRSVKTSDFCFHDLRHTAASWMRMRGADIHTGALILATRT